MGSADSATSFAAGGVPACSGEPFTVFTIGYEGRSFGSYASLLAGSGVRLVCDVRRNAVSRKPGFSRRALAEGLAEAGVSYRHFPVLGVPSEQRRGLSSKADYDRLFRSYRDMLDTQPLADELRSIAGLLAGFRNPALTCYEADASRCHRHCVAGWLADAYGWRIQHL